MTRIDVFDPPMCCSTGICGPSVDPLLAAFAADLQWLSDQGVEVVRHNLAQEPASFVNHALVHARLQAAGDSCLPIVLVNDQVQWEGAYPRRASALARSDPLVLVRSDPDGDQDSRSGYSHRDEEHGGRTTGEGGTDLGQR